MSGPSDSIAPQSPPLHGLSVRAHESLRSSDALSTWAFSLTHGYKTQFFHIRKAGPKGSSGESDAELENYYFVQYNQVSR